MKSTSAQSPYGVEPVRERSIDEAVAASQGGSSSLRLYNIIHYCSEMGGGVVSILQFYYNYKHTVETFGQKRFSD